MTENRNTKNRNGRVRLRVYLTDAGAERLESACRLSDGSTRSLLILEALQKGLAEGRVETLRQSRRRSVYVWVPGELKCKVRELANVRGLKQQVILRDFVFEYISAAPWNRHANGPEGS